MRPARARLREGVPVAALLTISTEASDAAILVPRRTFTRPRYTGDGSKRQREGDRDPGGDPGGWHCGDPDRIRHSSQTGRTRGRRCHTARLCAAHLGLRDPGPFRITAGVPGRQGLRGPAPSRRTGASHCGEPPTSRRGISVDDGTYDFYAVAYAVLKRLGVPVTVLVSTYYVRARRAVFDGACYYLLWKAWASLVRLSHLGSGPEPLSVGWNGLGRRLRQR